MEYFKKITESIYGEGANPMDPLGIGKRMREIVSGVGARPSGNVPPQSSPFSPPPPPPSREPQLSVMIAIDGDSYGPYDRESLMQLITDGTLTADTYVFIQGMSDWQTARQVPQVNALFSTSEKVPPPPPMPFTPPPPGAKPEPAPASVMSAKLDNLIESAIADGVITDLERKVLARNAQQEGIDIEEFCVIVDARLFERQKQLKQEEEARQQKKAQASAAMKPKPKADRVRRCPACNAPINSASLRRCPECGYEFDNVSEGSVKHLLKKLEEADREFAEKMERRQAAKGNQGRLMAFFSDAFDFEADKLETEHIDRKAAMIRTHPMPETREEVLEFLYAAIPLAVDHSDDDDYEGDESLQPVWKEKCEQVVTKGRFLIKGKPEQEALRDLARKAGIYF